MTGAREVALAAQIEDAFGGVAPPARAEMLHPEYAGNEDAGEMMMALLGKRWSEVPILDLFRHRESLFMLSPVGYRAYLPAYLSASLAREEDHSADVRAYMLYSLRPGKKSAQVAATTRQRLALLDARQRAAVLAVVRYLVDEWQDSDAVDVLRGWEQSVPGAPDSPGATESRAEPAASATPAEAALAAQLHDAFGAVEPPTSDEMVLPALEDDDEPYLMTLVFQGVHWAQVPRVDLFVHRSHVFALSAVGYRAVLPAYLAAALATDERFGPDGAELWAPALHALVARPGDDEAIAAAKRERLALLDARQRAAVVAILRHLAPPGGERGSTEAADILRDWERAVTD